MSKRDQQRVLQLLSKQISDGAPFSDSQRSYLADAIYRISQGEDANKAFGLSRSKGQKMSNEVARQRLSLILHWVACKVHPDPAADGEKAMSIAKACAEAQTTIIPAAKRMFPGADITTYDAEYLIKCWRDTDYKHLSSPLRGQYDADYPY